MKYPRTYHLPFSPGTTSDDRFATDFSEIIGKPIVITEKLDGENCGMNKYGVFARSHAAPTTSPWSREVRNLYDALNVKKSLIGTDITAFGENMEGIH